MITRALATTPDCRNGNCPTVWETDRGTVVVQGYAAGPGTVRVPAAILERAAAVLNVAEGARVPAQRAGRGWVRREAGGDYLVRGDASTGDVMGLTFPINEAGVELPDSEITRAVRTIKEAV
jgi:hypothetical protein